jgi:hypothetical protein
MSTNVSKRIIACCLIVFVFASTATAAITTYTNRALWQAAAGATTGENFNSYLVDTPFHAVPLDVGAFTISMTPGAISGSWNFIDVPPPAFSDFNVDGTNIANIGIEDQDAAFFTFDQPITSFGADFAAWNDGVPRSNMIIGADVISPATTPGNQVRFFGVTSTTPFTTVEFRGLPDSDGFSIDNLEFTRVPEPSTVAMLGVGAAGLLRLVRRRR